MVTIFILINLSSLRVRNEDTHIIIIIDYIYLFIRTQENFILYQNLISENLLQKLKLNKILYIISIKFL